MIIVRRVILLISGLSFPSNNFIWLSGSQPTNITVEFTVPAASAFSVCYTSDLGQVPCLVVRRVNHFSVRGMRGRPSGAVGPFVQQKGGRGEARPWVDPGWGRGLCGQPLSINSVQCSELGTSWWEVQMFPFFKSPYIKVHQIHQRHPHYFAPLLDIISLRIRQRIQSVHRTIFLCVCGWWDGTVGRCKTRTTPH